MDGQKLRIEERGYVLNDVSTFDTKTPMAASSWKLNLKLCLSSWLGFA
jgi:hypothetical protein